MSSTNKAESVVRNTLVKIKRNKPWLPHFHHCSTSFGLPEVFDFNVFVEFNGIIQPRLVEVKSMDRSNRKSIPDSYFKEEQLDMIRNSLVGDYTWIICRFYTGDEHVQSHDYWEKYCYFHGKYFMDNNLMANVEDAEDESQMFSGVLGGKEDGEYKDYSKSMGLNTAGSKDVGLKQLSFLKGSWFQSTRKDCQ